jgi:hypothetical protein
MGVEVIMVTEEAQSGRETKIVGQVSFSQIYCLLPFLDGLPLNQRNTLEVKRTTVVLERWWNA